MKMLTLGRKDMRKGKDGKWDFYLWVVGKFANVW